MRKAIDSLVEKVRSAAVEAEAHIEPRLVGSVAKGTHMKDPDIDLFVMFPESTPLAVLKEKGLEIGRRAVKGKEHFAQHPYVRGTHEGYQVDLVPCYMVKDPLRKMSAVDRTPFHTEFVVENLSKGQHDHVRLLKRFMKGIGCYGAEAKVQGFSGYLCELLVLLYGDFDGMLRSAAGWRMGESLALPGRSGSEFSEPLTFVDPVDSGRNVASAVSVESMIVFMRASREYIAEPDMRFFFPRKFRSWSSNAISKKAGERLNAIIVVSFDKLALIDDVLYPQLRKSAASMTSLLRRNDFEVVGTTLDVHEAMDILIEVEAMTLPRERVHRGPPAASPNAREFLAKWEANGLSKPYREGGRWYVVVEREHRRADSLLKQQIRSLTLGKDIRKLREFVVASGKELSTRRYARVLTKHLDDRMPWER